MRAFTPNGCARSEGADAVCNTSENARLFGIHADASSGNRSLSVTQVLARFVILINGEISAESVSISGESHLFTNLGRTDQVASGCIPGCGEVVQLVFAIAQLLPHAHAEVAGNG